MKVCCCSLAGTKTCEKCMNGQDYETTYITKEYVTELANQIQKSHESAMRSTLRCGDTTHLKVIY